MNNNRKFAGDASAEAKRLASLRSRLTQRADIIDSVMSMFRASGFLPVETPLRVDAPAPELHIDAEPSGQKFLITSPELHLKRLVQAGYDKVCQLCHCFRQGERGDNHLSEFTMLEWYRRGGTVDDLMRDCERLIEAAASAVGAYPEVRRHGISIDLTPPFETIEVADAFERFAGWRPDGCPDPDRFDRDLITRVEPALPRNRPVFLSGYPASLASLSRIDPQNPARAERFELYAGGLELANGFQELTDAAEQRRRFEAEAASRSALGKSVYPLDEPFLRALEQGLPECAGIALGMDRLVMLLTGAGTIHEVVAFSDD